jgi:hypothetical protein
MKKLVLTSIMSIFAASGAMAANVIDGNPLYMPSQGHFYSVTSLASHSENTDTWALGEEFGYGVTDKLAIDIRTSLAENEGFDDYGWRDLKLRATFRAFDRGDWKADIIGGYAANGGMFWHSDAADDNTWFEGIDYTWTAGLRLGYQAYNWAVAGHASFNYWNTESFNWGDEGLHVWKLGLDGQYVIDRDWNLVAGVEYTGVADDGVKNAGVWDGSFGVNYNIDATKFVGAYVSGQIAHGTGDWEWQDGFGFGFKFGVDF